MCAMVKAGVRLSPPDGEFVGEGPGDGRVGECEEGRAQANHPATMARTVTLTSTFRRPVRRRSGDSGLSTDEHDDASPPAHRSQPNAAADRAAGRSPRPL